MIPCTSRLIARLWAAAAIAEIRNFYEAKIAEVPAEGQTVATTVADEPATDSAAVADEPVMEPQAIVAAEEPAMAVADEAEAAEERPTRRAPKPQQGA